MKKIKIIFVLTICTTLFNFQSNAQDIVGTYQFDIDAMMEALPEEERSTLEAQKEMIATITMTFNEDGTLVMGAMGQEMPGGTWKLSSDKKTIFLTNAEGDTEERMVKLNGNQLTLSDGDGQPMILKRVEDDK